jgi:hypothetical protein
MVVGELQFEFRRLQSWRQVVTDFDGLVEGDEAHDIQQYVRDSQ